MKKYRLSFVMLMSLLCAGISNAAIWLPAIFDDHMVVQAAKPIHIWGKATVGERVHIEVVDAAGTVLSAGEATTAADKKWMALLPAVVSQQPVIIRFSSSDSDTRVLNDVLIGEVWLLSGQSNMRWTVARSKDAEKEIAEAEHPEIRLFITELGAARVPLDNLRGKWTVCSPATVGDFSGVGYYFGRDLQRALDQPVGLILSAVGGTPIHAWIPLDPLNAEPSTQCFDQKYKAFFALPPAQRPKARETRLYGAKLEKGPARLYHGMIHPLVPVSLRGILWYQGETNAQVWGGPDLYRTLFPMLIQSWRENFGQVNLPFIYVELANYKDRQMSPVDAEAELNWANIREAQASALALSNVYSVCAIDIGEAESIHPLDKQSVGQRLALAALGQVYSKAASPSLSPRYIRHALEGHKMRLTFSGAAGLQTDDGQPPRAFAIKGREGTWKWAETVLDGNDILTWHPEIPEPVAVRHAWANNPDVNVYNKAHLPLMPFRTDAP